MDVLSLFDAAPDSTPVTVTAPTAAPAPRRRDGGARRRRALLAVDGDSLTHRAFHAYGPQARYGVLALLAGIADQIPFDGVVVGFDSRGNSWRKRRLPSYKATRPPKPPALSRLLADMPVLLEGLGVTVVCADGHEADDVLGSAAAAATARGWTSVLATSDRDAYGLVNDDTTVLWLRSGLDNAQMITPRVLRRRLGIAPEQYVMYAALRGDTSDNLPGLPGVGPARARALLALYPTLADAAADAIGCRSVLGPALGQAFLDDLASSDSVVRRNVELMTIRRDLAIDVDDCARRDPGSRIEARLAAEGLAGVAGRVVAAFSARPERVPLPQEPDPHPTVPAATG